MEPDAEKEAEREAKEALLASKLAPGYFQVIARTSSWVGNALVLLRSQGLTKRNLLLLLLLFVT